VNITLDTDEAHANVTIESASGALNLTTIARTTGFYISFDNGTEDLLLHTTVEFADRMARAIRREVTAWRKRTREANES